MAGRLATVMRIGPEHWHWVTLDSLGVPSSGVYAGAKRFARLIAKHGWQLAWNDHWGFFVMYQVAGRAIIPHFQFYNWSTDTPIGLHREWIGVFEYLKRSHGDGKSIAAAVADAERVRKQELARQEYEDFEAVEEDVMRVTWENMGLQTKKRTFLGGTPRALVS